MNRTWLVMLSAIFVLSLLPACTDPEAAARALLNEGMTLQREGRADEATATYARLVQKYPQTEAAVEANRILLVQSAVGSAIGEIEADTERLRIATARTDIRALESASNLYRLDNFLYPTQAQGLAALARSPVQGPALRNYRSGGYMDRLPPDPWGNQYRFRNPGRHGEIDIFTELPDGRVIGNWNLDRF